jgi:excisionase family DNA binding protein
MRAKRAASAMATVEDLAAELGIGRNQAYALVQTKIVPAMRFGRRWLIPRAAIAKMVSGDGAPTAAAAFTPIAATTTA